MAQIHCSAVARQEVFRTAKTNQSFDAMLDELATFKADELTFQTEEEEQHVFDLPSESLYPLTPVASFELADIKGLPSRIHLLQHGANQHVDDSAIEYAALRAALLNGPQAISPSPAQAAQAPDTISAAFPNTLAQLRAGPFNPSGSFENRSQISWRENQTKKKAAFFACFKLKASTVPEGFVVAEDESPPGHRTICPVGPPHANHASVKVADDKLMCPALRNCWELHCLTFLEAATEPRPFQPSFDKDCWEAARVIFCQLSELDFEASLAAQSLLVLLDEQDYPSLLELDAEGTSQLLLLFEKLVETQMDRDTWEELIRLRDGYLGMRCE